MSHYDDVDPDDGEWADDVLDDSPAVVACRYCREMIHEDTERCPYCENYITSEDGSPNPKPKWIIIGLIVCLIAAVLLAFGK